MPEELLNQLGMHAPGQEHRGARMPKVVQPHRAGETGALEDRLEAAGGKVLGVHGLAGMVGEDEPMILLRSCQPYTLLSPRLMEEVRVV